MDNLRILKKFFGQGTAETESSFLDQAFVLSDDYLEIIDSSIVGPRILAGRKGSGKSAILRFLKYQMEESSVPVLLLRPKDINFVVAADDDKSLGNLTRLAEKALLVAIGSQIGKNLSGFLAKQEDIDLYNLAKKEGFKTDDSISKLVQILSPVGKAVSGIDFSKMSKTLDNVPVAKLKQAVASNLDDQKKLFYLLIDDTDQLAPSDQKDQLNRIWAFLLATRALMEECTNLKCIITLRYEVWQRLGRDSSGQRDQVDHFRDLLYFLSPDDASIKRIFDKRIDLACKQIEVDKSFDRYAPFFGGQWVRIPSTNEQFRYWSDFILKSSRERPRDSIQLISKLANAAIDAKSQKIESEHASKIISKYSEERADDLKREVDEECPNIKEIVRSFSDVDFDIGAFTMSPEVAYKFISSIPGRMSLKFFGKTLKPEDREDAFALWQFLFEIGFLNARVSDTRMRDGYRHISASEDPELVSMARWNDMQRIAWEIHPAYRSYLIKINREKSFSTGLPKKEKNKR